MIRKEGLRGLVKPGCKWLPSSGDRLSLMGLSTLLASWIYPLYHWPVRSS